VGHYVKQAGYSVHYLDPLADDDTDVIQNIKGPCVLLMAHNRQITYGYTGDVRDDTFYAPIEAGSIIVDPWRKLSLNDKYTVVHYGNSRQK
jgi:hypothetical protein